MQHAVASAFFYSSIDTSFVRSYVYQLTTTWDSVHVDIGALRSFVGLWPYPSQWEFSNAVRCISVVWQRHFHFATFSLVFCVEDHLFGFVASLNCVREYPLLSKAFPTCLR